jgi:hypothetical protein
MYRIVYNLVDIPAEHHLNRTSLRTRDHSLRFLVPFYARCWWYFTLHIINVEKNVSRLLFHFFLLPYLCLHTVGLVRMEVVWVCFDVLFFISEFHFLFLLIFILFSLACLYMCCWCFPLRCLFQCLFVCLFVLLFYFVFIPFFVFIYCLCYVTVLYQFFFECICCSKMRLSYSVCLLIDCIRCIFWKCIVISYA